MQRARWFTIALLLLAGLAAPLFGQAALPPTVFRKSVPAPAGDPTPAPAESRIEGPPILPGTIASTSIHVPAVGSGRARGHFSIAAFPNVRLFSDTTGSIDAGSGDVLIPVTYSVPRTQDVGVVSVARLYVDWSDGTKWEAQLEANVQPRRGLRVAAYPDMAAPSSADYMVVRYQVTNLGNGTDTVDMKWDPGWSWKVQQTEGPMVVSAGQTLEGTVNVEWPHGTSGGEMHVVQVTAAGRGTNTMAGVVVKVPFMSSEALGLVSAQSSVFVGSSGSSLGNEAPAIALNSASQLSPDTRVSMVYRRPQPGLYSRVFAAEVAAPQARFELRHPGFVGALGTVFRPVSSLLGTVAQGNGADVSVESGAVRLALFAARPTNMSLGNSSDDVLHASADLQTPVGAIGVTATGMQRVDSLVDGRSDVRAAGLHFRHVATDQRLNVELGYMQLQDVAGARSGTALDANYDGTVGGASLFGRVHSVPAVVATSEVLPSAASIGASVPIADAVSLNVSGSQASVNQIGQPVSRAQGLSAGVGFSPFGVSAQLMANLRRAEATPALGSSVGRTLSSTLTIPFGSVSMDGYAEVGTRTSGDSVLATRLMRGGVRWAGDRGYLWAGLAYAQNEMPGSDVHLETSGSLRFGPTQWEFGASLNNIPQSYFVDQRATPLPINIGGYWTRVSLAATATTMIVGGVEYQPQLATNGWRLSLGVQQALELPLPLRRPPVVSGEVFDDLNGDGVRDENEPGVAGVVLKLGGDHRQTTSAGDFNFADWQLRGQRLEVDPASLPEGYVVRPDLKLVSRGHVMIPLIKAATLIVVVHVTNSDGSLSERIDAPDGLVATLTDGQGRERDAAPVRGIVNFDAVLPGDYQLTVSVPSSVGIPGGVTQTIKISVKPGDKRRIDVGAPSGKREIRFGPTTSGPASSSP